MEGKLSMRLFSPSSISFDDNVIVRNFTLRSLSKICGQLEGNLHLITFDYRTKLDVCQAYRSDYSITKPMNWSFSLLLGRESWSKSCECKSWGLVAFIMTLMGCRETILVDESPIDFLFFSYFLMQRFLFFLFSRSWVSYFPNFFEQPCRWTPCNL